MTKMAKFSLKDKNILITGASSGIGVECCMICSNSGANVILSGRNINKLNSTFKNLKPADHTLLPYDLVNLEGIENVLGEILKKYGKIDGFIHSAGIDLTKPLNSTRYTDYQALFNTNVISGFEIARVLSKRQFCPEEGASYIYIASVMGLVGESAKTAYCSSKGALLAGCRSMALELASKKIRVNCISPGIVQTELVENLFSELPEDAFNRIKSLHPLGFGTVADIANTCVFLLSDEAKWITGSNLVVDGGYSCQ